MSRSTTIGSAHSAELILALPRGALDDLLARQLEHFFTFDPANDREALLDATSAALNAVTVGFRPCRNKYFSRNGAPYFDPFHSGHYAIFLYHLSRALVLRRQERLADRVYYLNKALNGLDLFHQVDMPPIFFLDHPVAAVIGRGSIGNFFCFCQSCTIGNNHGVYPTIEDNVIMHAASMILGKSHVGPYVILGAGTIVIDQDIPTFSLVSGRSPDLKIKSITPEQFDRHTVFHPQFV